MKQSYKTAILWVFLIVVFATIWNTVEGPEKGDEPSFNQFVQAALDGKIAKITINPVSAGIDEIEGVYAESAGGGAFKTKGKIPEETMVLLMESERNIQVNYSSEGSDNFWGHMMMSWLR